MILDVVIKELPKNKFRVEIGNLIAFGFFEEIKFPSGSQALRKYAILSKRFGKGKVRVWQFDKEKLFDSMEPSY